MGEFNDWDHTRNPMTRAEYIGIYTCFVPGVKEGMMYKFCIETITGEYHMKQIRMPIMQNFVRVQHQE